jgi:hypothetical protein
MVTPPANAIYNRGNGMIRTPSAATVRARAATVPPVKVSRGPR